MATQRRLLPAAITGALLATMHGTDAATITVDTASDNIVLFQCTLRQAIAAANIDAASGGCAAGSGDDVIEFDPSLSGATIVLQQGQLEIESSVTIEGQPGLSRDFITVSGANTWRIFGISDLDNQSQLNVTLRDLVLRDGYVYNGSGGAISNVEAVTIDNCTLTNNTAVFGGAGVGGLGGAILNSRQLTVRDSLLTSNSSNLTGGALSNFAGPTGATATLHNTVVEYNYAVSGGGLHNLVLSGPAELTVDGGTIRFNTATTGTGGGIFSNGQVGMPGTVAVTGATISGNSAGGDGGGAAFLFTNATVTNSTLDSNSASGKGGGFHHVGSDVSLTVIDSVLSSNQAGESGGALYAEDTVTIQGASLAANTAALSGGAVQLSDFDNSPAALTIENSGIDGNVGQQALLTYNGTTITDSTIANNAVQTAVRSLAGFPPLVLANSTVSSNSGAGLNLARGVVTNSTIVNNSTEGISYADELELRNSVIAGSALDCDTDVTLTVNNNNLIEDGSCSQLAVNMLSGDPVLGPLASTRGMPSTHQPQTGSPLVDAGDNTDCPATDQTGMPRPIDGNADGSADCDIGAVEFVDLFPPLATLSGAEAITVGGATSHTVDVAYTDIDGAVDLSEFDTGDITVTPGPLTVINAAVSGPPTAPVVTYTMGAPGGSWDADDNGEYAIAVNDAEVFDTAVTGANPVAAATLGSFTVAVGEIDVQGNNVSIADGDLTPSAQDGTAFGEVVIGQSLTRAFTVSNTALSTIEITAPISVAGAGFEIAAQPATTSIAAGQSVTFDVRFVSGTTGPTTGIVSIENDDGDESPYSFAVSASGVVPEIDVSGNGQSIVVGDNTPATTDATDFGDVSLGAPVTNVFTITNVGTGTINLPGPIEIFGAGFGVTQPSESSLGAGQSTTFAVDFSPVSTGSVTGLVTIPNTDADENPYTFAIAGNGIDPPPLGDLIFEDGFE